MKVEKEIRQVEVFKTEDGREFLNEKDADNYVINVLKRRKDIQYFQVIHSPDLTEGRGSYGRLFIAVEKCWSQSSMVELFCEQRFGSRVAWVQGCSPTENWRIIPVGREDYEAYKKRSISVGDYSYKAQRLFLSDKSEPFDDYPKAMPMPHRDGEKFPDMKEFIQE